MKPIILVATLVITIFASITSAQVSEGEAAQTPINPEQIHRSSLSITSTEPVLARGSLSNAYTVPLPAARNGLTPNLSFTYNSSSPNGVLGVGWGFSLGAVTRDTRFGIDYSSDRYVISGMGATGEIVKIDSAYSLKSLNENVRIRYLRNLEGERYWEITHPNGTKYLYGTSNSSRIFDPKNHSRVYSWLLARVEDPTGNYMTVSYERDSNQLYPEFLRYNKHADLDSEYTISFNWENREDPIVSYRSNFQIKTTRRLEALEVRNGDHRISKTALDYDSSALVTVELSEDTRRSILVGIFEYGNTDSYRYKPLAIQYTNQSETWSDAPWDAVNAPNLNREDAGKLCVPGDFNGDFLGDIACLTDDAGTWSMLLSGKIGPSNFKWENGPKREPVNPFFFELIHTSRGTASTEPTESIGDLCVTGNFDNNKTTDLACYTGKDREWSMFFSTSNGWEQKIRSSSINLRSKLSEACLTGDFNGDQVSDIACLQGSVDWNILMSTENGWDNVKWKTPKSVKTDVTHNCFVGDFTGNTHDNVACNVDGEGHWIVGSLSDSKFTTQNRRGAPAIGNIAARAVCWSGDLNSDGLSDISCFNKDKKWQTSLSSQNKWNTSIWKGGIDLRHAISNKCTQGDYNGDGRLDLACNLSNSDTWKLQLSASDRFYTETRGEGIKTSQFWKNCFSHDFDGDLKADIACHPKDNDSTWNFSLSDRTTPDLIANLTSAYGAEVKVKYGFNRGQPWKAKSPPVLVVSNISSSDGREQTSGQSFSYFDPLYHFGLKEFRGFGHVERRFIDESANAPITKTWFHQGNGDLSQDGSLPDEAPMVGRPYKHSTFSHDNIEVSRTNIEYVRDFKIPYFQPVSHLAEWDCEIDNDPCFKHSETKFSHDNYGNLVKEIHERSDPENTYEWEVSRKFASDLKSWMLRYPTQETVSTVGLFGTVLSKTIFYYDGPSDCSEAATSQMPSKGFLSRTIKINDAKSGIDAETWTGFDQFGNISCARDGKGNLTRFTYDETQTFQTSVVNPLEHTLSSTYYGVDGESVDGGPFGKLKSTNDPVGGGATWEWDHFGRPTRLKQVGGGTYQWRYINFGDPSLQHIQREDSLGMLSRTYFDGMGRAWRTEESGSSGRIVRVTRSFDRLGNLRYESVPHYSDDPHIFYREFNYDNFGRLTQILFPDGSSELTCYDSIWAKVIVDKRGSRRKVFLNGNGTVKAVANYAGTFDSCQPWTSRKVMSDEQAKKVSELTDQDISTHIEPYATTNYSWDLLGNLTSVKDALGNESMMTYNSLGQRLTLDDPNLGLLESTYDANGNVTRVKSPIGSVFFTYDSLNRIVQKDLGSFKARGKGDFNYKYDAAAGNGRGRLNEITSPGHKVRLEYDVFGRIVTREETTLEQPMMLRFSYDKIGRVSTMTYPDGDVFEFRYDGPVLSEILNEGTSVIRYDDFNSLGLPRLATYGNGLKTRMSHSGIDSAECKLPSFRLCELETYKGDRLLHGSFLDFGKDGNLIKFYDSTMGNQRYSYDPMGRLSVLWTEEPSNETPDAALKVRENALEISTTLKGWALFDQASFNSWLEKIDNRDELVSAAAEHYSQFLIKTNKAERADDAVQDKDMVDLSAGLDLSLNLPASYVQKKSLWNPARFYSYDEIGGIRYRSDIGSYTYPAAATKETAPHAPRKAGPLSFTYDQAGNLKSDGRYTYTFDPSGNLVSAVGPSVNIEYGYSEAHEQVYREVTTTDKATMLLDSRVQRYLGRVYRCEGKNNCTKSILADRESVMVKDSQGNRYYTHTDHLGSLRFITDQSGNIVAQKYYSPFGTESASEIPDNLDVSSFAGQSLDTHTGFHYFGKRFYNSQTGQFISPDSRVTHFSSADGLNRYSYAGNNPLILTDPNGELWFVAAIAGGLIAGYQSDWDPGAIVLGAIAGAAGGAAGSYVGGLVSSGVGGGVAGTVVGGAVGGATGAATGALVYRAAGYNVDVGKAAVAGYFGGAFGSVVSVHTTPAVGAAFGGGISSDISGGDFWEGAGYAALGVIVQASVVSARPGQESMGTLEFREGKAYLLSDEGLKPLEPGVYSTHGTGSFKDRLWHLILGDAHSHVFVSTGDGDFRHATDANKGVAGGYVGEKLGHKSAQIQALAGRKLQKAAIDVNPRVIRTESSNIARSEATYGLLSNQYVCTTFASTVTSGQVIGLMPGQMVYNTLGYRPGYHYYSFTVHRSSR